MTTRPSHRRSATWGCDRRECVVTPAPARLGVIAGLGVVAGCTAATVRPSFGPSIAAPADTFRVDAAELVLAARQAMIDQGIVISRMNAQEGYLETRWFDAPDLAPATDVQDDRTIRMRVFTDPVSDQQTQVVIEAVYRWTLDPSLPERQMETIVPSGSPGDLLARSILDDLGEPQP